MHIFTYLIGFETKCQLIGTQIVGLLPIHCLAWCSFDANKETITAVINDQLKFAVLFEFEPFLIFHSLQKKY